MLAIDLYKMYIASIIRRVVESYGKEASMAKTTKAQQKAVQKYVGNNYDRVVLTMPKGTRAEIKAAAEAAEKSMNTYIMDAVYAQMEKGQA